MAKKPRSKKTVEALKHDEASRKNIPTAEYQSLVEKENAEIREAVYARNRDLDPQLVWRGKDEQDWSDLVVPAPPTPLKLKWGLTPRNSVGSQLWPRVCARTHSERRCPERRRRPPLKMSADHICGARLRAHPDRRRPAG